MLEGHILNERYEIQRTIGGGGMANVYLARDRILERDVAIKVLRLEYANDAEFIARFDREAQSATSLSHPNIVNIYDVGEEDHILYMVMEYVDGLTLKEYIQTHGPLNVEKALDIMKQVSRAIAHAHANGLIHRDIKPQNILIDSFDQVKVTDFGIALALSATSLTQTNSIVGSVHYLSPEQARGGAATKKSDIYALGVVLYEMLTGELPFSGQSPVAIALQHLQHDVPSIIESYPYIPQSVENIVLKATSKDPLQRYESVYEMESALEAALDPTRQDEPKFVENIVEGEDTKAIPVITDEHFPEDELRDTIIHKTQANSPVIEENHEAGKATQKKKPKKKRKRKKWLIISGIIVLLLTSIILALFVFPQLFKTKDVKIPDVVGVDYEEAVEILKEHNLKSEKDEMFSEDLDENYVIKTNPATNRTVKENSVVTLYISKGKEKVEIDDYQGKLFSEVKKDLESQGYKEVVAYDKHSEQPEGEILEQIQPSPGEKVIPSETKVIFEVSIGPELVTLNNLRGMTESEVKSYLDNNDLLMETAQEFSDDVAAGKVIKHEPASGSKLEKNRTVKVFFSKGKERKDPIKKKVKFTVPYKIEADDDPDDRNDQEVEIYIGDLNNDISDVYKDKDITKDKEFTITLTIGPDEDAEYKVYREDELLFHETFSYDEVNE